MTGYPNPQIPPLTEDLRLEAVTVSVDFDDMLDVTLAVNHPHLDTLIVVTSHEDKKTQAVCHKHGAICVQTDLFSKNGRKFNKGAAINAGFNYFQYFGFRLHIDSDIMLPDNFRRLLFNHHHLATDTIYGADRVDVIGRDEIDAVRSGGPQHRHKVLVESQQARKIGARFLCPLNGYLPLGYFQLWHAKCQKAYPYSLGTAAHDDTMFSALWPRNRRQVLPGVLVYHVLERPARWSENWEGQRKQPRLGSTSRRR